MKKMTEISMEEANGGAKVRAICWTCYNDEKDTIVWAATKSALTVKGAKKAALKQLTAHTDGKLHGHNVGYIVY